METTKIVCPKCGRDVKIDAASRGGRCSSCDLSYSLGGAVSLGAPEALSDRAQDVGSSTASSAPWHKAGIKSPYTSVGAGSSAAGSVAPSAGISLAPAAVSIAAAAAPAVLAAAIDEPETVGSDETPEVSQETEDASETVAASETVVEEKTEPIAEPSPARTPYRVSDAERAASVAIANTDKRLVTRRAESLGRASVQKKLRRADSALAKKKWGRADALYDEVLTADPERAEAYLGKALAARHTSDIRALGKASDLSADKNFLLALHYSDGVLRRRLDSCADASTKAKINESRRELSDSEARRRALDRITETRLVEISRRADEAERERKESGISPEEADRLRTSRLTSRLDKGDRLRTKKKWKQAAAQYRAALDVDGECSEAYVGLLLTDLHLRNERELASYDRDFESNENFLLAVHYGSRATRKRLEDALSAVQERNGRRPVSSSVRPIAIDQGGAASEAASSDELSRMSAELDKKLGRLALATSEKEISYAHILALEGRLAAAEKNALQARINSAEAYAIDTRNDAFDKAELTARLSAAQVELAHLRGLLGAPYGDEKITVYGTVITTGREEIPALLKEADKLRGRGKFLPAEEIYRKVLTLDPTCSEGYLGCLLCELRLKREKMLDGHDVPFSDRENYALAVRFATPETAKRLTEYAESTDLRVSKTRARREKGSRENARRLERARLSQREAIVLSEAKRRVEANVAAGLKISHKEEGARLDEAYELMAKKKFAAAKAMLDELISLSPDLSDAYLLRLMCTVPCRSMRDLCRADFDLRQNPDYILACRYGSKKTRRQLAKYAEKSRYGMLGKTEEGKRKLGKLGDEDAADERDRRLDFNRRSGDVAEAQRADMDVISARKAKARARMIAPNTDKKLLAKGDRALRRKKWLEANRCFDEAIQKDPACQQAFLGKLLASIPVSGIRNLEKSPSSFSTNRYYIVLMHIGDPELKEKLERICKKVDARLNRSAEENERLSEQSVTKRRLRLTERRLRDAEARNRHLEAETERLRMNKSYDEVYGSYRYGEEFADGSAKRGRVSPLTIAAFMLGTVALTLLSVGIAVLFAKFGGDLGAFLGALGL